MSLWMRPPQQTEHSFIAVFRNRFTVQETQNITFEFSADEKVQLFLDGKRLLEGPERGCENYWYKQYASICTVPGEHTLTARVTVFSHELRAYAQMSVEPGFYFCSDSPVFGPWDCQIESGLTFEAPFPDWASYPRVHVNGGNRDILSGKNGSWLPVEYFEDARILHEPDLPLMRYEKTVPQKLSDTLFYFPTYSCVWASYRFSGKGQVKIRWSETPYLTGKFDNTLLKGEKGRRNGKFFLGKFDIFEVNGEYEWYDFWWKAGHYVEIETSGDVKVVPSFFRTGYPLPEYSGNNKLVKMAYETLHACSMDTYLDCPFYEQLMYTSDSRLEALSTYAITDDHRLPAKALKIMAMSQQPDGSLYSHHPAKEPQKIPEFSLIWFLMYCDYFRRHPDDGLCKELEEKAIKLLDYFKRKMTGGLLYIPGNAVSSSECWNFIDWCDSWDNGVPPGGSLTSMLNFFLLYALQNLQEIEFPYEMETWIKELAENIDRTFYVPERGLYAIDPEKKFFSEHSQILALLTDSKKSVINALKNEKLTECSISFSYYYIAGCRKYGLHDLADKRVARFNELLDCGLTTLPEEFHNTRSDCHAWSSHILLQILPEK